MRTAILILAGASVLTGCSAMQAQTKAQPDAARGLESINVPVVTRQDYVFDAAAPQGYMTSESTARLDGWFQGLDLGYGDNIFVEGDDSSAARRDVARIAGRYGLMVSEGGPVLASAIAPGAIRIVVSRTKASVPDCPNWSAASQPNFSNKSMSNYGCGVNANLAAMVANPLDLIHGREGNGVTDAMTSNKAVESYRKKSPTGDGGLKDISTKGN